MESEYMALSSCTQEALFISSLLRDMRPANETAHLSVPIAEDNQATIRYASNRILNSRSKHIDIRHHFIRDHVRAKRISIFYIPTNDQLADCLTKCLDQDKVEKFRFATFGRKPSQ